MNAIKSAFGTIIQHRKAFIFLCAAFYGVMALSMTITMFIPTLKPMASSWYDVKNLDWPIFQHGLEAYASGDIITAATVTFLINLGVVVFLTLIPSLIVPFVGIASVFYRGLLLGAMLAPFGLERVIFIPHAPTVIIECLAYLIGAFAAYVHGVTVMQPARYGFASRWDAYKTGLITMARLYVLVVILLIVGAAYEAYEVIYLLPFFVEASL